MKRDVTITASQIAPGQIEFEMREGGGPDTEILVFNKAKDGIPKSEFYDVEFALRNKPGTNLVFVTTPAQGPVMFLSKGSDTHLPKCPTAPASSHDGQITVTGVTANTLKVQNKDETECFYKFVLRFEDRNNGNKIVEFDPIWGNQNGP